MPPAVADWAVIGPAAGDHRRPHPVDWPNSLIGAVALSVVVHVVIVGLASPDRPQVDGSGSENVTFVEIVLEAPAILTAAGPSEEAPPAGDSGASDSTNTEAWGPSEEAPAAEISGTTLPADSASPEPDGASAQAAPEQPMSQAKPPRVAASAVPHRQQPRRPEQRVSSGPQRYTESLPANGSAGKAGGGPSTGAESGAGLAADDLKREPGGAAAGASFSARTAADSEAGHARLLDAYARVVWARIDAHKPKGLRLTGSTRVSFVIAANGMLTAATIVRSSGSADLDGLALDTLRDASPFPPPPPGLGTRPLTFEITFTYH